MPELSNLHHDPEAPPRRITLYVGREVVQVLFCCLDEAHKALTVILVLLAMVIRLIYPEMSP